MRALGIASGLAAASIWGGMYVVSKVILDVIPPFMLVTARLVLGAGAIGLIVAARGGLKGSRGQILGALGVGVVGYGLSLGLQFIGTRLSTAANASLVTTASPAFIFLFGVVLLRERARMSGLIGLVMATLGVLAVIDPRSASLDRGLLWGNLALLGASVTWGLYSVLVKVASRKLTTLEVSLLAFLGGLPLSVPAALLEARAGPIGPIDTGVVFGVLYLGLVSTALAMFLWNKSLALLDAGLVAVLFFAQPVVGAALAALILHETLGPGFWVGAVLIGGGLLVAGRAPRSQPGPAEWGRGEVG